VRRPGIPIAVAAVALLLAAPLARAATDRRAAPAAASTPAYSSEHLLVEWAARSRPGARADARAEAGVGPTAPLGGRFQLLEVETGTSAHAALQALRADPAVAAAERDGYAAPNAIPDDPLFDQLWGLEKIGAPAAWDRTVGTPSTVIADIDSGYRFEHPDLAGVAWDNPGEVAGNGIDDDGNGFADDVHGYDFIGADGEAPAPDPDPTDDDLLTGGHGVHTAGTIGAAGDNGVGITGVAQDARIMPLRVCSRFAAEDKSLCRFSAMVGAINYAGENGARVANMSIGNTVNSTIVSDAIAANPDVLFVISAGNDGQDNDSVPHYPCNFDPPAEGKGAVDNVICVAATDPADGLASFSDWGATSVDLGAPGTEILSTYPFTTPFADDFELDDFASRWPATGADGGFERTSEAPLTSFGMTDASGPPAADTVRETTSAAVTIPANGGCRLNQTRRVVLGGTTAFRYSVLLDGEELAVATPGSTPAPGLERRFLELHDDFEAGGSVQVRFRLTAGAAPAPEAGVWLDNLSLVCAQAVGQASAYAFLQGTSMAAPHVSGAAGLLFSLRPGASVTEVREALLDSADPAPALAGMTVTGGRLDVAAALENLEPTPPPDPPQLQATSPASPADDNEPRVLGTAAAGTSIDVYANATCAGAPAASGSVAELESAGIAVGVADNTTIQIAATATDAHGTSACSAPISYTEQTPPPPGPVGPSTVVVTLPPVAPQPTPEPAPSAPSCTVPKLAGKTLAQAKAALASAGCQLGKVRKPKPRKGHPLPPLVIRSSSPAAGAASSGAVSLTLGPKPKRHRH
jgi:subtilisin family serine protease